MKKWGIDFVGPISPSAINSQARYIIVAIDYFTKWAEARATRKANAKSTAKFLYEQVISRYGCPLELIRDRGTHFLNEVIAQLTYQVVEITSQGAVRIATLDGVVMEGYINGSKLK